MIRVGLPLLGQGGWQGGRNYLLNLIRALREAAPDVQPVLLVDAAAEPDPAFRDLEIHRRTGPLATSNARRLGGLGALMSGRDLVEERWLRDARVDVYSHGRPISGASVPTIFWLGDLQHRMQPHMFSRRDRWGREVAMRQGLRHASVVVASSETSRLESIDAFGAAAARVRVLRFATLPTGGRAGVAGIIGATALAERKGLPPRWIHLPNQFWKHKNHDVVVDALALAPDVIVVATGPQHDFRHPGHFDAVMRRAHARGVRDRFRVLGLVDEDAQLGLMRHAVAVLNPSWFEGWSTTVEEAKALGKRVILSDLAVHREQAPERAVFFPPDDAETLARALREAWEDERVDDDVHVDRAMVAARARVLAYGRTYRALLDEALIGRADVRR